MMRPEAMKLLGLEVRPFRQGAFAEFLAIFQRIENGS